VTDGQLDLSSVMNQLVPLITSIFNMMIMFYVMKTMFGMMERTFGR